MLHDMMSFSVIFPLFNEELSTNSRCCSDFHKNLTRSSSDHAEKSYGVIKLICLTIFEKRVIEFLFCENSSKAVSPQWFNVLRPNLVHDITTMT